MRKATLEDLQRWAEQLDYAHVLTLETAVFTGKQALKLIDLALKEHETLDVEVSYSQEEEHYEL